jgi:DNA polymerase III subunit epsilon
MELKEFPFLIVDCQTTGMRPSSGHLLEIAWCIATAEILEPEVKSFLVELPPGDEIPDRVQELTGIRMEDLNAARPLAEIFNEFHEDVKKLDKPATALIHYAQFEKPWLLDLFERHLGQSELPFHVICTHSVCKRLFPTLPSQNIRGVAGFFGDPVGAIKRAKSHVLATHQIWRGLIGQLKHCQVTDLNQLHEWLRIKPAKKERRYDYRLDKVKRLDLPDCPGVYRMLAKTGEVLYVGKATSLKSRVNSYFRGYKGRDKRKLEMLAQVWDLDVTSCQTALEAALLESDEIKRFNPPYNVVMKRGRRHLVFYSRGFDSIQRTQDRAHPIGPFRQNNWIEHVRLLEHSLASGEFEQIFFEPIDPALLSAGFELFRVQHNLPHRDWSVRKLLAYGLHLHRHYVEPKKTADDELEVEAEGEDTEYTAEDLAGKFERLLRRAGAELWRSRDLTRLLDSQVVITHKGKIRELCFAAGRLGGGSEKREFPWQNLDLETFDRMSVLRSELEKYDHQIHRTPGQIST